MRSTSNVLIVIIALLMFTSSSAPEKSGGQKVVQKSSHSTCIEHGSGEGEQLGSLHGIPSCGSLMAISR